MSRLSPSLVAAGGLIGGFAAARYTKRREVGGAVFSVAGAVCQREWRRRSGRRAAAGLGLLYTAAMGGSHPLAKKLGAWPSVLAVAAATGLASELVTRTVTA
ncbi:MAG: hypothetical protein ACRDZY_01825 [Acidimicrobiales bacterium]